MDELVSILIPVFNRSKKVKRAIDCSIDQTYKNIEIIVVDNCSTDDTWAVLRDYAKKDSRIKIFRNKKNIGPVNNWIECLNRSSGKYTKILFSDDWMDNTFIEITLNYLKNKDVGFVYSLTKQVGKDTEKKVYDIFNNNTIYLSQKFIYGQLITRKGEKYPVSPGCSIFRKSDLIHGLKSEIKNPLNINYSTHGAGIDLLLFLIIAKKYKNVCYVRDTSCYFYGGQDSITINEELYEPYMFSQIYFLNNFYQYALFLRIVLFIKSINYSLKNRGNLIDVIIKAKYLFIKW